MAVKVTVYGTADMRQIENARAELDKLEAKALASSGGFAGSMTRIGASLESMGDKMTAVGGSMTQNLTLPLAAAGAGIAILTNGAAEDAQQQAILATALQNTAGATAEQVKATEDWISAQGRAYGVTDDQLRPAIQTLATATGDLSKAQELASLAMDVAAAKGIPVEDAAKAIAKAYSGQGTALKKLIPGLNDATLASGDFSKIQEELTRVVGGQAAAAADTQAGAMQRAKVALSEAGESIGTAFLPVMQQVADIISNNVAPAIEKFAGWLGQIPTPVLTAGVALGALLAAAGPLLMALGSVTSGVGAFMQILPKLGGALGGALGPIGLVVGAIAALIATSPELQKMLGDLIQQVGSVLAPVFQQLWTAVQPIIQQLGQTFSQVVAALVPIIGQLLTALAPLITTLGTVLAGILQQLVSSGLLQTIADAFLQIVQAVMPVVQAIAGALMAAIQSIIDSGILQILADAFIQIINAVLPLIPVVAELIMAFLPLLPPIAELIGALIPPLVNLLGAILPPAIAIVVGAVKIVVGILQFLIGVIAAVVTAVVDWIAGFISNAAKLASKVGDAINSVIEWFKQLPTMIGNALSGAATWLVNVGRDIVDGLWNGIKNGWRWLTDQVNNLVDGLVGGIKDLLGIHSPSRVFAQIGSNVSAGMTEGILAGAPAVSKALNGLTAMGTAAVAGMALTAGVVVGAATIDGVSAAPAPSSSRSVVVAEGAVQITFQGATDTASAQQVVEDAFAQLVRELRAS